MERGLPLLGAALALALALAGAVRSDKCGGTIKIENPGYLTSPGYPHSYHPSEKCEWLIQAPEPYHRIMINFNPHFDLEDRDCNSDSVPWKKLRASKSCLVTPSGEGRETLLIGIATGPHSKLWLPGLYHNENLKKLHEELLKHGLHCLSRSCLAFGHC